MNMLERKLQMTVYHSPGDEKKQHEKRGKDFGVYAHVCVDPLLGREGKVKKNGKIYSI